MSEQNSKYLYPLAFALVLAFGVFLGTRIAPASSGKPTQIESRNTYTKIDSILQFIDKRYVDSINADSLVHVLINNFLNKQETIDSLFKMLDPHSNYIPAKELQSFNEDLQGNFDGIGIEFNIINDTIYVVAALAGGPSEKLGILSGDKIIAINDSIVAGNGITNESVVRMLRGKKGTQVNVKIYRKGEPDLLAFEITRDKIPVNSVDVSYMVTPEIGYIRINKFGKETPYEFAEGIEKLKKAGMKKLIMDLRGNPGGYLTGAVDLADQLLPGKKLIVYTDGRSVGRSDYFSSKIGAFETGDLAVLINEGSASASEILSGALQDNKRATIIGHRSFGKGLVQEVYTLPDNSAIRLTIARYYTPNGKSIQRSYAGGVDAYYDQYVSILMNGGELPDSLKNNPDMDWGIHPDIQVPVDTSAEAVYFNRLYNRGFINQFAYSYYSDHTAKFSAYKNVTEFNQNFQVDDEMFKLFIAFADSRDSTFRVTEEKALPVRNKIDIAIKAFLARQKWGNDGFFPIMNEIDMDFQEALKFLTTEGSK
ncbi:MAG: S41 family peptidase [Bacteroidetes bacterium]|nr:S41 family peptidase [Bacteroidota bacterium]